MLPDDKRPSQKVMPEGRRSFFFAVAGGIVAAFAGWVSGVLPRGTTTIERVSPTGGPDDLRINALEAEVARLSQALSAAITVQPLADLEGQFNERVTFNKRELTVASPEGVFINLVATKGHVGFRFYKDFGFGNETVDSPWSIYIEELPGYQGLAFLRDWRFTAALWDEDGKLLLGRLDPYPPGNEPALARLHVRGTVDEVQAMVQASPNQAADVFQVTSPSGASQLAVNSAGSLVLGSREEPRSVILFDTEDNAPHSLHVANGQLTLTRL
jgi:hypothetical protein